MREVLGVAALVEEGAPVVRAADRLDHQHNAVRHLDRRTERTRALVRALVEVERDVLLRLQVDAEVGERAFQRGNHPVGGKHRVPLGRPKQPRDIPALRFGERDAHARAEELVGRLLVQTLRRVEEVSALLGQLVERRGRQGLAVQLEVVGEAEVARTLLHDARRVEMQGVHVLVEQVVRARVQLAAFVAVRLVRKRGADHAVRDLLALDGDGKLGFQLGELLCVVARQVAEVALAGETPELADARAAVDGEPDRLHLFELGQVRVALVDRRQVEGVLQAGVMEIELLVELGDKPVRLLAIRVELPVRGRG